MFKIRWFEKKVQCLFVTFFSLLFLLNIQFQLNAEEDKKKLFDKSVKIVVETLKYLGETQTAAEFLTYINQKRVKIGKLDIKEGVSAETAPKILFGKNYMTLDESFLEIGRLEKVWEKKKYQSQGITYMEWTETIVHENVHMHQTNPGNTPEDEDPAYIKVDETHVRWFNRLKSRFQSIKNSRDSKESKIEELNNLKSVLSRLNSLIGPFYDAVVGKVREGTLSPGLNFANKDLSPKIIDLKKEIETDINKIQASTKQTAVKKPPPPKGGKLQMDLQLMLYVSYSEGYKDEQQTWPRSGFRAFENMHEWKCFIINEGGTFSGGRMDGDTESWVEGRRSADRIIELKWKNHEVHRTNGDKYREEWWEIELEDISVNPIDPREYILEGYNFETGEYNVGFEKHIRKLEHKVTFYPSKKTITLSEIFFQKSEVKKLEDLSGFGILGDRPYLRVCIFNPDDYR